MKIFVTIYIFLACAVGALAQEKKPVTDSLKFSPDSIMLKSGKVVSIKSYAARFNPRKALLYSAIFPGAGQIYNKKYWKVPIVYGLIGGTVLGIVTFDNVYQDYREQLFGLLSDTNPVEDPDNKGFTLKGNLLINGAIASPKSRLNTEQLRNASNRFRRDRDFAILLTGVVYLLQIVDAHVDAHLKEFDINPEMRARLEPSVEPVLYGRATGLSLTFTF